MRLLAQLAQRTDCATPPHLLKDALEKSSEKTPAKAGISIYPSTFEQKSNEIEEEMHSRRGIADTRKGKLG
jgi:hypothetical protein